MEIPYSGRAIITEHFDKVEIIIPSKKRMFLVLFFCVWLCGWVFGEATAIAEVSKSGTDNLFMMVWLAGWTVGGFFAMYSLWVMVAGKEFIEVGQGVIAVKNQALFFMPEKVYDLKEVKNIRIEEPQEEKNYGFGHKNVFNPNLTNMGTIRFDYGMKTIKFGNGIDEAEAKYIVDKLKSKRILTDQNF
ncbi:hypothetical protein GWR56_04405 [Mucilaginibacter sp. 14171R-50]|uniref:hypothetical protein n=1 Tax=Mucilaginibacter sp. 14171R-50 TaxID=2703789 RepID=UPI00138D299D|nr:hypothetical protein [Mucilaginibacter sp. 14171R-50]QHS54823.1 hypothetical protein GWR56_04405 [Mucilaginibacter sp. 14171R-50]